MEAAAGSGKTTTIVTAAKLIPSSKSCLFLAYNKKIAEELAARLPQHVQAKTFHSHCFDQLKQYVGGRIKVDKDKCRWIFKDMVSDKDFYRYNQFVTRLCSFAKSSGYEVDGIESPTLRELIAYHNLWLDEGNEDEAIIYTQKVLTQSINETHRVDFDDMLYMPLAFRGLMNWQKFNYIFVDEAQDTNAVQRALLRKMLPIGYVTDDKTIVRPVITSRLIAVGDTCQSIYGFRGSDSDAMNLLQDDFHCHTLPLSVSYRCSQKVVEEAQRHL